MLNNVTKLPERSQSKNVDITISQPVTLVELDREAGRIVRARVDYTIIYHENEMSPRREHGPHTFQAWPTVKMRDGLIHRIVTSGMLPAVFEQPLPIELKRGLLAEALERGATPAAIWQFALNHGGGAYHSDVIDESLSVLKPDHYRDDLMKLAKALAVLDRLERSAIKIPLGSVPGFENLEMGTQPHAITTKLATTERARETLAELITYLVAQLPLLPEPKPIGHPPGPNSFHVDWRKFIEGPTGRSQHGDFGIGMALFNATFDDHTTLNAFRELCRLAGKHQK